MPAFNYTTGNPNNLAAGINAAMADIQGSFTDVKTALNGGLDETNVPNLSAAFTSYERIARASGSISGAAATYAMQQGAYTVANVIVGTAGAHVSDNLLYLDPAIYAANSRVTKLNLRYAVVTNAIAPAITFTAGLYPIATYAAAGGAQPTINTVGTVISGSTVAVASPPGSSVLTSSSSGDFNFPAAGAYVLCVITSGTVAANAVVDNVLQLEMRRV